jgi:DNA-binding GntR family transcriptional regulator
VTPEKIAEALAVDIRERALSPGAALIQEDIARRFGVSRNPVREALRLLEGEGLIEIRAGEGATVRVLSNEDLDEIYSLRLALEPGIATYIIDGATARSIAKLESLVSRLTGTQDIGEWMRLNFAFHDLLYSMTERPRTVSILRQLLSVVQPYSYANVVHLDGRAKADVDHRAIVDAVRDGDVDELASLLESHLAGARTRLSVAFL